MTINSTLEPRQHRAGVKIFAAKAIFNQPTVQGNGAYSICVHIKINIPMYVSLFEASTKRLCASVCLFSYLLSRYRSYHFVRLRYHYQNFFLVSSRGVSASVALLTRLLALWGIVAVFYPGAQRCKRKKKIEIMK